MSPFPQNIPYTHSSVPWKYWWNNTPWGTHPWPNKLFTPFLWLCRGWRADAAYWSDLSLLDMDLNAAGSLAYVHALSRWSHWISHSKGWWSCPALCKQTSHIYALGSVISPGWTRRVDKESAGYCIRLWWLYCRERSMAFLQRLCSILSHLNLDLWSNGFTLYVV